MSSQVNSVVYFVDNLNSPFVVTDIKKIAAKVDSVVLFHTGRNPDRTGLPVNVIVMENYLQWNEFQPLKVLIKNLSFCITVYLSECRMVKKILPFKKALATLASNIFKAQQVTKILGSKTDLKIKDPVFYSFWFYDCIFLARLKQIGYCRRAIVRAHGGDLFEYRGSIRNNVLFRNYQLKYIDRVMPVSKTGTRYLQEKYPAFSRKIVTSFLGSRSHQGISKLPDDGPVIVSCARVRNIKRIHLIAESLRHLNIKLTWYHIGDENLANKTDATIPLYIKNKQHLAEKSNIIYKPLGALTNEEVYEFYRTVPVSLFLSLSQTEGLPVSMMEAISFGIPVLSTDVGGCREIVTAHTGILIPENIRPEEVARVLENFLLSDKNSETFRYGVRKFWEAHFNIENNYKDFYEYLLS
jgi:glycosyltransferase involved in cell wall biosynthesis